MTDLNQAATETADFEGFRTNPYKDSLGFWTMGEGRCLEKSPLTGAEWKYLLDAGLIHFDITALGARHLTVERLAEVEKILTDRWSPFVCMPEAAQTILVEMGYQLGVDELFAFHTFLDLLSKQQYSAAAADGRGTRWYSQTPVRAESLMKRLEKVT